MGGCFKMAFNLFRRKQKKDKKNKKDKYNHGQPQQGFVVQPVQQTVQGGKVSYNKPQKQQQYAPQQQYYQQPMQQQQQYYVVQQQQTQMHYQQVQMTPEQLKAAQKQAANKAMAGQMASFAYNATGQKGSKQMYDKAANTALNQYQKHQMKQQAPPAGYYATAA